MALKIRWSPHAVAHLEDICKYIAEDSRKYASIFASKVLTVIKELPQFPKSGRKVPEYNDENLREKICGNYRIVYRIKEDFIEVAAICHSAKLFSIPGTE